MLLEQIMSMFPNETFTFHNYYGGVNFYDHNFNIPRNVSYVPGEPVVHRNALTATDALVKAPTNSYLVVTCVDVSRFTTQIFTEA